MLAHSSKFDRAARGNSTPIGRVDMFTASGRLLQRGVPVLDGGSVTADKLSGTLRVTDVYVPLAALLPETLRHLTEYPGDVFIQRWRGFRHQSTTMHGGVHDSAATWTPAPGSLGEMVGVIVDETGAITLGQAS